MPIHKGSPLQRHPEVIHEYDRNGSTPWFLLPSSRRCDFASSPIPISCPQTSLELPRNAFLGGRNHGIWSSIFPGVSESAQGRDRTVFLGRHLCAESEVGC